MKDKDFLENSFDIKWTCSNCGNVSYSNKGYATRQCQCRNMSPFMKKEYTKKGIKNLKEINNG